MYEPKHEKNELIWVDKEFAKEYKKLSEQNEKIFALHEYLNTVKEETRKEYQQELECMKEDAAIYSGLLLQVKRSFGEAKQEHFAASYELWEEFEKDLPSVREKVEKITDELSPLKESIDELKKSIAGVDLYRIERVLEAVTKFNEMSETSKTVMRFLINNFPPPKTDKKEVKCKS